MEAIEKSSDGDRQVGCNSRSKLKCELEAICACNQALVRVQDEETLLREVCRIVCEVAGYSAAWVGFAEADENRTIRPVAWVGVADGYLAERKLTWADTERGQGPVGTAVRTGRIVCLQDFSEEPRPTPWRDDARERGFRSLLALPLENEDSVAFGVLCVLSSEPGSFGADQTRLLSELAGDLAFGVTVSRTRAARRDMEKRLQESLVFFENLDKVNRAIQGAHDLESMADDVLDASLRCFDCDGAFLRHPCDPDAVAWNVQIQRTRPECPGVPTDGIPEPFDGRTSEVLRACLESEGPRRFGPGTGRSLPTEISPCYGAKSLMAMVLRPGLGQPWLFGILQCSGHHVWSGQEEKLFREIGDRLTDALTTLLSRRALRESENRFRMLTETLTDYHYSVRIENGVPVETKQSPACEEITGYSPEDFAADPYLWINMVPPKDREQVRERVRTILGGKDIPPIEHRIRRRDGKTRWVLDTTILSKDASGRVLSYDGVVKDITERKRAEDEIYRLNRELERRVADRTAQLESANKELEAFAYSVSHDLRAPLRHISGYAGLLVSHFRDSLPEKGRHYVDTVAASARQMSVLIDNLLQFSRLGRAGMRKEGIDMNRALREALDPIREATAERSVEWVIGDLPPVEGDHALLCQVWANLLGNAAKYTGPRPAARIEVRARDEGKDIVYSVADNGVGFDMKYVGKLFGVFQRLHPPEEFEGTGIGLAIVQRIVKRHGGRVWARGEPDMGATFFFSLPNSSGRETHV